MGAPPAIQAEGLDASQDALAEPREGHLAKLAEHLPIALGVAVLHLGGGLWEVLRAYP